MAYTDFQSTLKERIAYAEQVVSSYLPEVKGEQSIVMEAMRYSVLAGGKRLRPVLIHAFYELFGGAEKADEPFMAAMEYIHTYSLIHDDLPAMDNDDYRRGRLTCHKVYGEDMAILAGDALLNYAYEVAGTAAASGGERQCRALLMLASKAGIYGMVGGQTVDVANDGKPITADQLMMIYENKTGALIEAAMMTGAILGGADEAALRQIECIASCVGLAFQIQDDILDVTGTMEELGKPIGSDAKNAKTTYVTLYGLDAASRKVRELSDEAVRLLETLAEDCSGDPRFIRELILWLISRRS